MWVGSGRDLIVIYGILLTLVFAGGCAIQPDANGHVDIPSSWTSIGDRAFNGCSSLKTLSIPNSVTRIDSDAFKKCQGLESVTIPDSVTSIGDNAFY